MGVLDKYSLVIRAPKIDRKGSMETPIIKIRNKFLIGVDKQKAQAKNWKPGVKDLRSWVTRDEARGLAWVTVKYGARPIPIKGNARSTIGPVKLGQVTSVFDDIKKAAKAGELDAGLKKASILGPRKNKRGAAIKER